MKRPIFAVMFAFLSSGAFVASAATLSGSLAAGLHNYYSFDGNANDSVGGSNGTSVGAALTFDQFGNPNSAYSFNGVSSQITGMYANQGNGIPNPLTGNFTFSFWFKAEQAISIISEAASGTAYSAFQGNVNNAYWSVGGSGIGVSAGTNGVTVFEYGDAFIAPVIVSQQNFGNSWVQAVVTVANNGAPKLYINGNFIDSGLVTGRQKILTLFDMCDSGYGRFKGSIDEIAMYDRALSGSEVSQLYSIQSVPELSSLILCGLASIGFCFRRVR